MWSSVQVDLVLPSLRTVLRWTHGVTHLPGLHLLRPPPEGHVGVAVGGAVPPLLLDVRNQRRTSAGLPLPHPVIVDRLQQVVILIQQQLGLRQRHQLRTEPEPRDPGEAQRSRRRDRAVTSHRRGTWWVLAFSRRSIMVSNCRGLISIFLFSLLSSVSSSESRS